MRIFFPKRFLAMNAGNCSLSLLATLKSLVRRIDYCNSGLRNGPHNTPSTEKHAEVPAATTATCTSSEMDACVAQMTAVNISKMTRKLGQLLSVE